MSHAPECKFRGAGGVGGQLAWAVNVFTAVEVFCAQSPARETKNGCGGTVGHTVGGDCFWLVWVGMVDGVVGEVGPVCLVLIWNNTYQRGSTVALRHACSRVTVSGVQ